MSYSPGPAGDPVGGAQRAAREDVAAVRAVGELELLAGAGEVERVIAHHVSAAQGVDAELAARPRADHAHAPVPFDLAPGRRSRARATTSAMRSAVPLGASSLRLWCISTISRSNSGPASLTACSHSQKSTFTPTLKLGAYTTGTASRERARAPPCTSASMPVVPDTTAHARGARTARRARSRPPVS